jgi:hypothetical protein
MAKPYDLLLSHNSQGKPAVERLVRTNDGEVST